MRLIRYKRSEFLWPWKWRHRKPLHEFLLRVNYALYWSVVPSREALNDFLKSGASGGGMGTGFYWDPFELTLEEYDEVTSMWKGFDLREVLRVRKEQAPDLTFIFDDEILRIPVHLDYLRRSSEKYEHRFWKRD